ncbi:protein DA1 [Endozoicomonas gorgoniicola]|uniref:Protein DA1 n=2 Tax=Endozoicomonas gorgoniicola TaxID=1234144 RepID=A0ABT3MU62_9GAMM|nr:protein DA1 [Endozoicomonas gorgoniicola]MCW7552613.1 protein DA1 [Endozoicomonas gorgoniicola]
MPWHLDCHRKLHRPLCSVCRKPLTRNYLVDFWGNAFCNTHTNYSNCSSCGRIVCKHLTDGGMLHPDGLLICNLCTLRAVDTQERAESLLNEMRLALASVGLKLNQTQTPVILCDRDELRKASRHNFHNERPILGLAQWTTTFSGGRIIGRQFDRILIQSKLPEEHFRTIAIHELTHAWLFYNQYHDLPLQVEEGMCVLMEYIWLKNQDTKDASYRRTLIEQSRDPIYGEGFQKARAALKLMPLRVLLRYLQEKNSFPSRFSAFFYH